MNLNSFLFLESLSIDKLPVTAIIPFYNPENIFRKVIEDTLPLVDYLVLVNDGSTQDVTDYSVNDSKIHIYKLESNSGKGAALKRGFSEALALGSRYILTLDSDYQHEPKYIPLFLDTLKTSKFVIGKRNISFRAMPFMRVLSNTITSKVLSIKTKQKIFDSQSGYRGFDTSIIPLIIPETNGFEAESEMILRAAKNKIPISFIDISTKYDNQKSSIKAFNAIISFIKVIIKY
ncbi:MAG: glycosyltransferase family 2 protein [Ignavibacteriaceae bacterium]